MYPSPFEASLRYNTVSSKLRLPIYRVGVGERIEDLQEFDAHDFCRALVGA